MQEQESLWLKRLAQALTREKIREVLTQAVTEVPDIAASLLSEYLKHPEGEIQIFVMGLMARHYPLQSGPILLDVLKNSPAWDVREAAAEALVVCSDTNLVPQLGELLKNPDWDLVIHCLSTLGAMVKPICLPWLLTVYQHPNAFVRKRMVEVLANFPWSTEIEWVLLQLLNDDHPDIVVKVVRTLGSSSSWRTFSALETLAQQSHSPELQSAAHSSCQFIRMNLQQHLQQPLANPIEQLELLTGWCEHGNVPELKGALESQVNQMTAQLPDLSATDRQAVVDQVLGLEPTYLEDAQQQLLQAITRLPDIKLPVQLPPSSQARLQKNLLKLVSQNHPIIERQRALALLLEQADTAVLPQLLFLLDEDNSLYEQLHPHLQASPEATVQLLGNYMRKKPSLLGQQRVVALLAHNQDIRTVPFMLRLLRDTKEHPQQQRQLKQGIADFGVTAWPLIQEHLLSSPDATAKQQGLDILALLPPMPQTSDTLMALLGHSQPEIRLQAGELLKSLNTHTRQLFERALNPQVSAEQRELTVDILSQRGAAGAKDLLALVTPFAHQPTALQLLEELLRGIGIHEIGSAEALPLLPLLQHALADVRKLGLRLVEHGSGDAYVATVLTLALTDQYPDIQQHAKRLLAKWPEHTLREVLQQSLKPEAELEPLAHILQVVEPQWRLAVWQHLRSPAQHVVLLQSWGAQAGPQVLPQLVAALQHPMTQVQVAGLRALAQYPYPLPELALGHLLRSSEPDVVLAGLGVIGAKQLTAYEGDVLTCSHSPDQRVRGQALICVGQLGLVQHLPLILAELQQALQSAHWELQKACTEALGYLRTPAALDALRNLFATSQTPELQLLVLEAIANQASPEANQLLLQTFTDHDDLPLRLGLVELFGRHHNRVAYRFLIEHWQEWQVPLQRKVMAVLGAAEERWILPHLIAALQYPDWRVQWTVIEALGHSRSMDALTPLKDKLVDVQHNHHLWGWILRSALWESLEALRQQQLSET